VTADGRLSEALTWLDAHADPAVRDQMGPRYGIHTDQALGVAMKDMKALAKELGRDHGLAAALWSTGGYEARTVAALIDEPARVDGDQMDRWAGDFDNWAICDTVCFNLFDRTTGAWTKVDQWAVDGREFVTRASFALIWALALHDKAVTGAQLVRALDVAEAGAADDRPLVSKAVIMAMRAIGKKHPQMAPAVRETAQRLAASGDRARARVGRAVVKELPPG
jgi:3-methyladenine DNA glycosylase AlkD